MSSERRLLELTAKTMNLKGYARKTQQTYLRWIKEYILFHGKRDPLAMGVREIEHFKNNLDVKNAFSFELKKEALQALTFLYTQVLGVSLQNQYIQAARNLQPNQAVKKRALVQTVMVF
jgi:predicted aldo/keto reductase-like oxidoreductase